MEINILGETKDEKKNIDCVKTENAEASEVEIIKPENKCFACLRSAKIEPVMFGMFLASALSDIVVTNLILNRTCEVELKFNHSTCSLLKNDSIEGKDLESLVQPRATYIIMGKNLLSTVLPALLSFYFGPWSDRNGRRPLLISPLIGNVLTYALYALLSMIPDLPPTYILLAVIPLALSGGNINAISSAHCYVSDITKEEDRMARLGLVGGAMFLGLISGTLLSSFVYSIHKGYGYVITFSVSSFIHFLTLIYTYFVVPETVVRNEESKGISGIFKTQLLKEMFTCFFKKRENNGRAVLILATFSLGSCVAIIEGEKDIKYLFTRFHFGWNFPKYQTYMAAHTVTIIIGAVIGLFILPKRFKVNEFVLQIVGFSMRTAENLFCFAIPPSLDYLMYFGGMAGFLGGVVIPVIRKILTNVVPKEDLGKVFSLTFSVESLIPMATNPLYIYVYNSTINNTIGAFFLISAALNIINVIWFGYVYGLVRLPNEKVLNETKKTTSIGKAEEVTADLQFVYS